MGATPLEVTEIDAGGHVVVMGRQALRVLDRQVADLHPTALFVLGDENTLRHCLPELLAQVPRLREARTLSVEGGEKAMPNSSYLTP